MTHIILLSFIMEIPASQIIDQHITRHVTSCTPEELRLSDEFQNTFPILSHLLRKARLFHVECEFQGKVSEHRILLWTAKDNESMGWQLFPPRSVSRCSSAALLQKELGGIFGDTWGGPNTIITTCGSFLVGEAQISKDKLSLFEYAATQIVKNDLRVIGAFPGGDLILLSPSSDLFCASTQDGMDLFSARVRSVPVGSYQLFQFEKTFVEEIEHAAKLHLENLGEPQNAPSPTPTQIPIKLPNRKDAFDSTFVEIPGGEFRVGHASDDPFYMQASDIQEGNIDPFWICVHEVTIQQILAWLNDPTTRFEEHWLLVAGVSKQSRPPAVALTNGEFARNSSSPHAKTETHPISGISWSGAMAFCDWLSAQTGDHYRLPTQIEWEYACRAGTSTLYYFGDVQAIPDDYAWYEWNCNSVMPVGQKLPNKWGLFDMAGNVEEWCSDSVGFAKPLRGGSYRSHYPQLRSATRNLHSSKSYIPSSAGFRLVVEPTNN